MEMVKKFGLWIVAGVIAIAAIVVYLFFVHTLASQANAKRIEIEDRRDKLMTWAHKGNQIPNPTQIRVARQSAEQVAAMLDQCELYLARQPRWCETIRFFTAGPFGPETEVPLDRPNDWLNLYRQYNQELQQELADAGMAYRVDMMDWGTSVPSPEAISAAMEVYWFQKDLIDFLTGQVEKDFAAYLEFMAKGRADPFPAKPFDLVVNRSPARLDEFLRSTSREKLVAVLGAIIVNRQQQDLATIFNALLPDEKKADGAIVYGFPWERPASEREHGSVRGFTMDEAQEKFLAEMLPLDKPDLSNRQRFLDYVMELRMVRYRADVIGLLESHHFDSLAAALRRGTEPELAGILNDIADVNGAWNTTRIAEAISAIVSINNMNDFLLVRNNHAPNIAALVSLTISTPGGTNAAVTNRGAGPSPSAPPATGATGPARFVLPGRGTRGALKEGGIMARPTTAPTTSENGVYRSYAFEMQVRLRFERIPVFVRRLISNSWRYRVQILDITPSSESAGGRGVTTALAGRGMPLGRGGMTMRPERGMAPPTQPTAAVGAARRGGRGAAPPPIEVGNYVVLKLIGEGYQFSPLLDRYRDKLENRAVPAAPAPAGRPAAPTGTR